MDEVESILNAASVLAAGVPNDKEREAAERIILQFKKSPRALALCREILRAHSDDPSVLFYAFSALKDALLAQWTILNRSEIQEWKSILMQFLSAQCGRLPSFVQQQLCLTLSVIMKRSSNDAESKTLNASVLSDVVTLMQVHDESFKSQLAACNLLESVLNEFNFSNSSSIGQSMEFHQHAKYQFQNDELLTIFRMVLAHLHEFTQGSVRAQTGTVYLTRLLSILEKVFLWDFTTRSIARSTLRKDTFRPPGIAWREIILFSDIIEFLVSLKQTVIQHEDSLRLWLSCVTQLASTNGDIFRNSSEQMSYLCKFIHISATLSKDEAIYRHFSFQLASIYNKLGSVFPLNVWKEVPQEGSKMFFGALTELTCLFCELFLAEEINYDDDHIFRDSLQLLLSTWALLIADGGSSSSGKESIFASISIGDCCFTVFSRYVQCRISAPTGLRPVSCTDDDEIEEAEESDRMLFQEQLDCVALLGRVCLDRSVPLLIYLLESSIEKMQDNLSNPANCGSPECDANLEDVHWLTLISAHLIADEVTGETPVIPYEVLEYSLKVSDQVCDDMNVIHRAFIDYKSCDGIDKIDPLIRLTACVFNAMNFENGFLESNRGALLSPEVSCDILYFMCLLSENYILYKEDNLGIDVSKSLRLVYSDEVGGGAWLVEILVRKVLLNVVKYSSECSVIEETLRLMLAIVEHNKSAVFSCAAMNDVINLVTSSQRLWNTLPGECCRVLIQALLLAAVGSSDITRQLLQKMLIESFQAFVARLESTKDKFSVSRVNEYLMLLELLRGSALGCHCENTKTIFSAVSPLFPSITGLMSSYLSQEVIVVATFQVFIEFTASPTPFLDKDQMCHLLNETQRFFRTCVDCKLFQATGCSKQEKEACISRLELALQLLFNIVSIENTDIFGDFNPEQAVAVSLFALGELLPSIQEEALQIPALSSLYYNTISTLFELHPEKLSVLSDEHYQKLVITVESALTTGNLDNTKCALECVSSAAVYATSVQRVPRLMQTCQHLMYVVIQCLIDHTISREIINSSAEALLNLIQLLPTDFSAITDVILAKFHANEKVRDRLQTAFCELLAPMNCAGKQSKTVTVFKTRLDKFLDVVGGLLIVR